jgi:glycosyltransferase involved in cell wall biosynthesis
MEKVVCVLIKKTSDCHKHAILALDGNTRAKQWIKDTEVRFFDFVKSGERSGYFQALYRSLREIRPELLITYNWGATDAIWLGRLAGVRNILHNEHGFNVDEGGSTIWKRDLIRFLVYRLVSKVIVVSHDLQKMLQRRFLLCERRVKRIPNGIDASYYSPDISERQRVRRSLGFVDSDLVLGFSGRLDPVKNLDLLVDIVARCLPCRSPFRLLIVGDGPERRRLETSCRDKKIHEYVVFTGQQEQVLPYLRAMDVFLLTSLREQMPLTVLEAMAVGIPVMATRVGEIPYIIDDGTDGFIRDLNAPVDAFVEPLCSLLDSSQRKAMGEAAREKMLVRFQHEIMVQQYAKVIQEFEGQTEGTPKRARSWGF